MTTIPTSWRWVPLDEVVAPDAPIIYGILQPGPDVADGIPYVRPSEISGDEIRLDDLRRTTPEIARKYRRASLEPGDVLLSIVGTIGKVAIVPPELRGANITQSSCRIRPASAVLHHAFLAWFLRSPVARSAYDETRLGTGVPRLNIGQVREFPIALPPLNEQRRIVAKIDALMARSRRAKESLDAIPPLLERLRQSILAAAFRGDLTADWRAQNPDVEPAEKLLERIRTERRRRWEEATLEKMHAKGKAPTGDGWKAKYEEPARANVEDLPILPTSWAYDRAEAIVDPDTVITYGIVLPKEHVETGVPYVRGQDIVDGEILIDQLLRTHPDIAAKHSRSELRGGDVLLCVIRHLKVAVVPSALEGGNLTQGTVRMRPSFCVGSKYLAHYLAGPVAQSWMKQRYFGMDMPRINVEDARAIPVPVAPKLEQEEIARRVDALFARVAEAESRYATARVRESELDRAILAKAFRGELVPQDPNDEPAEQMLARLANSEAPTKSKRGSPRQKDA